MKCPRCLSADGHENQGRLGLTQVAVWQFEDDVGQERLGGVLALRFHVNRGCSRRKVVWSHFRLEFQIFGETPNIRPYVEPEPNTDAAKLDGE